MHTDQILNDPLGSGKPEFSQTQPGHDLGVSMDHRPLPAWAVWTWLLSLCLRLVRDLCCMDAKHVVARWVRARKFFVYKHTNLWASAHIMCIAKKEIFPDVYSSTHENIYPQKFFLASSCMVKHTKIPAGITEPHTSDDETESSLSLKV